MSKATSARVLLHGEHIGNLIPLPGERTLFTFTPDYAANEARPTLSLSFKGSHSGELLTTSRPARMVVPPFFSNLLPEGPLRTYLARRAETHTARELPLLVALGNDLSGAVAVVADESADFQPPRPSQKSAPALSPPGDSPLRFSLAGVQLKFSAIGDATRNNGLTIPTTGEGGSWIVKLPSARFPHVPENEFSMMALASKLGLNVAPASLVACDAIEGLPRDIGAFGEQALAVKRFDRTPHGAVHMEDFAQVFGLTPQEKYERATCASIARVIGAETCEQDVVEFIRRLVFCALIGNADMHLKNWALLYPDTRKARLAPAYDLVSTIAYIPDSHFALKFHRKRAMEDLDAQEIAHIAGKAGVASKVALDAARETVDTFHALWEQESPHLPLSRPALQAINAHRKKIALAL